MWCFEKDHDWHPLGLMSKTDFRTWVRCVHCGKKALLADVI